MDAFEEWFKKAADASDWMDGNERARIREAFEAGYKAGFFDGIDSEGAFLARGE